ncbi:sensor histidine kinase [Ructibacterium gallinarum]|uniref:Histidine kinase n=1 Tax=Ructibacterium gallinarum TaxID=2779355 RepID=A0A9D5R9C5_9FIRM|nr:sensor histidine kinase [Ructibacterium gallinarum]MBE5040930.1 histidine kinase [Ructibacterium gallinarum]
MFPRAWTYIKNFRFQSVFFKYVRLILCIIIVPILLINVCVFFIYSQINEKDTASSHLQTLAQSMNAANLVFQEVDNLRRSITGNPTVLRVLSNETGTSPMEDLQSFAFSLAETVSTHPYLQSVYVYNYATNYCHASKNSAFFPMFYDPGFLEQKNDSKVSEIGIWNREVPAFGGAASVSVLTVRSPIYIHDQLAGLFIINLSLQELTNLIAPIETDETLLLVDENGQVLFSSSVDYIGKMFADTYLPAAKVQGNTSFSFCRQNGSYISCLSDTNNRRQCYLYTPVSSGKASSMLGLSALLFIVISVLGSLILSFLITTKFYQSLIRLIQAVQFPDTAEPGADSSSGASDYNEFTYITDNIAKITDKNKEFEKKLMEQLEKLKKSQSIALQTQMNPHFLFNTLQAVNLMTIGTFKEDNKITQIVALLADLLHYMLDTKTILVPLEQEIELTEKYLKIQNIKYCDQFMIHWDIAENTAKCRVIKLILQPIVENAILHGILPAKRPGNIWISSKRTKELLYLTIEDDGAGIPDAQLHEYQKYLGDSTIRESEHLGLTNTHQRIQLIFGKEYGLTLKKGSAGGTKVELKMPVTELAKET